jgi:hypothetical protein
VKKAVAVHASIRLFKMAAYESYYQSLIVKNGDTQVADTEWIIAGQVGCVESLISIGNQDYGGKLST